MEEVDIDVGHLLAQLNNGPQHLESPDLEEEEEDLSTDNIPAVHSSSRPDQSAHRAKTEAQIERRNNGGASGSDEGGSTSAMARWC